CRVRQNARTAGAGVLLPPVRVRASPWRYLPDGRRTSMDRQANVLPGRREGVRGSALHVHAAVLPVLWSIPMSDYPSSKQVSSQCLRDVKDDPESAAVVIMQQSAEIERLRAALEAASVTNVAVLLRDSDAQNQRLRAALSEIAAMRFDTTYVIGAKEIARRALAGLPHETTDMRPITQQLRDRIDAVLGQQSDETNKPLASNVELL